MNPNYSYEIRSHVKYPILSFPINCEFFNGVGYSLFPPSFSQSFQFTATPHQDDGCEEPGCYEDLVTYSHSQDQIEAIIAQSTECEQSILLNCTSNLVTGFR